MSRFFLAVPFAFLLSVLVAEIARADEWVQIEAHPTLAEAEGRARAYAGIFPDVQGYRLRSGWYAIALGPYGGGLAAPRLRALVGEGMIPRDSYVQDGTAYVSQFWPVGGGFMPVTPAPDEGADVADVPGAETIDDTPDDVPADEPDETVAEARRSEAALDRPAREELQTALQWEGVYSAAIDGAFGPGTRNAMAAWQEARGYEATGVLTSRQRAELVGGYRAVIAGLGLESVRDNTSGIEIRLPMALVERGPYQPPFAHFAPRTKGGPQIELISQAGDQATLGGLYDILQTLEIVPLDGTRSRSASGFVIEGANREIVTHAEARLTKAGHIKGFILIWPQGDDRRRQLVLTAMRESFTPLDDAVLPATAGDGGRVGVDLMAGLEIRRPDRSRTGFYVDARGHVVTSADAVAGCERVTLDSGQEAAVMATDAALGLALVAPSGPLAPIAFARLRPGEPQPGSEAAVSGYAYDGRLGAPVLTFGSVADVRGLDGNEDLARLSVRTTSGEAGAPVFDGSGAVLGVLLAPPDDAARVLPDDVAFAAKAAALARFLDGSGIVAAMAEPAGDLTPEALTGHARDMTVRVACWN